MTEYSDELEVAYAYMMEALSGSTGVTDFVGDRIFDTPPPDGTLYPYIIVELGDTSDVRTGTGAITIMSDNLLTVKAVMEGPSIPELVKLASEIKLAVTLEQPQQVGTNGIALSCVKERTVRYTEKSEGTQYTHRGGDFRLHTQLS